MKKFLFGVVLWSAFMFSCTHSNSSEPAEITTLKQKLPALEPDQALMKIMVGERDFYAENLPFKTNILLLPQSLKLGFLNKEGSNVEMELIRDRWFESPPYLFTLADSNAGESGGDQVIVMIGKLIDQAGLQGEGYFLINGKVEVLELSRKLITVVLTGNLVKPGQASTIENYIPVKGWIVVKEPDFTDQSSAELLKKINEK
jgi:hypothetical protein